jgi:hypothetical protein
MQNSVVIILFKIWLNRANNSPNVNDNQGLAVSI